MVQLLKASLLALYDMVIDILFSFLYDTQNRLFDVLVELSRLHAVSSLIRLLSFPFCLLCLYSSVHRYVFLCDFRI